MKTKKVKFLKAFKELFNKEWRNIVYYGGRASGKSRQVALALLLQGRQGKLRILCTREIQRTIKDSVHKLLSDLIDEYGFHDYDITKDSLINTVTGSEFIFKGLRLNINEIKSTEGIDRCWVEEAQSITEHSLNVLTPTIRKKGSQLIFTFNRYAELDPVFKKFILDNPPNTFAKHVNYDVLEEAGLLSEVISQEIEEDKKTPALYAHKWLGEPISQSEFSAINREAVLGATNRTIAGEGAISVGVDVARFGADKTVFYMIKGLKSIKMETYSNKKVTETAGLLEQFIDFNKEIALKIDDTGVGGGLSDLMEQKGYTVIRINFGGKPNDSDKYTNWISEAWFNLASKLSEAQIINDRDLLMELTSRQWRLDSRGRRAIESKEQYKKRGFTSPDCFVAGTLIATPSGDKPIERIIEGDTVITPMGNRKVIKTWATTTNKITKVDFSNGNSLAGKGSHRVFTWDRGWVQLDALMLYNEIETNNWRSTISWYYQKRLSTKKSRFGFKHRVDIIRQAGGGRITRKDFYIDAFGQISSDRYLRAMSSTMLMVIGLITQSTTLKSSKLVNTLADTFKREWRKRILGIRHLKHLRKQELRQRNGTQQRTVGSGIANTPRGFGKKERKESLIVKSVALSFGLRTLSAIFALTLVGRGLFINIGIGLKKYASSVRKYLLGLSTNTKPVAPVLVQTESVQKTKVYNLTLDKDNAYYANGVLVENCADACILAYGVPYVENDPRYDISRIAF